MSNATAARLPEPLLSDAPLGEVTKSGDSWQVVFHRRLRAPIEKVWAALTVPERLADWFTSATIDLRVGGVIHLSWTDVTIAVCEPPRSLAWTWELDGRETLVRFDLVPTASGCELTLTHSGLKLGGSNGPGVRSGWHAHLEGLPDAIEGRKTPSAVRDARDEALKASYPKLTA